LTVQEQKKGKRVGFGRLSRRDVKGRSIYRVRGKVAIERLKRKEAWGLGLLRGENKKTAGKVPYLSMKRAGRVGAKRLASWTRQRWEGSESV